MSTYSCVNHPWASISSLSSLLLYTNRIIHYIAWFVSEKYYMLVLNLRTQVTLGLISLMWKVAWLHLPESIYYSGTYILRSRICSLSFKYSAKLPFPMLGLFESMTAFGNRDISFFHRFVFVVCSVWSAGGNFRVFQSRHLIVKCQW